MTAIDADPTKIHHQLGRVIVDETLPHGIEGIDTLRRFDSAVIAHDFDLDPNNLLPPHFARDVKNNKGKSKKQKDRRKRLRAQFGEVLKQVTGQGGFATNSPRTAVMLSLGFNPANDYAITLGLVSAVFAKIGKGQRFSFEKANDALRDPRNQDTDLYDWYHLMMRYDAKLRHTPYPNWAEGVKATGRVAEYVMARWLVAETDRPSCLLIYETETSKTVIDAKTARESGLNPSRLSLPLTTGRERKGKGDLAGFNRALILHYLKEQQRATDDPFAQIRKDVFTPDVMTAFADLASDLFAPPAKRLRQVFAEQPRHAAT